MSSEWRSGIKEFFNLLGRAKGYLLAHHPSCEKFEEDCYHIGEKRLCVGCFTAYPTVLIIITIWLLGVIDISTPLMFLMGLFFGSLQFLSLTWLSDIKAGKIIVKIFLGIGIGFFTIAIFSLPIHWILRLCLFFICLNLAGFFSFLRMRKIKQVCDQCEYERNWARCPGFKFPKSEDEERSSK